MTFYAVELDICPTYGWQGGPSSATLVRTLRSRRERRQVQSDLVRHTFLLPFQNIRNEAYLTYLKNAHLAMYGMAHSFLVKDWLDYRLESEPLGLAPSGSAPVQITRSYPFGPATRVRPITKPVAGLVVRQNGVVKPGTTDLLTGLFTPSTDWTPGATLTADGEFRIPVRFNNDALPMSIETRIRDGSGTGTLAVSGSVELVEVFGE